jgi:hypothetical protein
VFLSFFWESDECESTNDSMMVCCVRYVCVCVG